LPVRRCASIRDRRRGQDDVRLFLTVRQAMQLAGAVPPQEPRTRVTPARTHPRWEAGADCGTNAANGRIASRKIGPRKRHASCASDEVVPCWRRVLVALRAPDRRASIVEPSSWRRGKPPRGTAISPTTLRPWASSRVAMRSAPSTPRTHAATSLRVTGTPGARGSGIEGERVRARFAFSLAVTAFATTSGSRPASTSTSARTLKSA
jgi:hypothetical protein